MVKKIISVARDNYVFRRFPTTKQLTKFAMVGVTNFFVDLLVYVFLTRTFIFFEKNYLLANALAFVLAVLWSFVVNKFWTFRNNSTDYTKQYGKFFIVYAVGLGWTSLLLYLAVDVFSFYDIPAKFVIAIIVMFWNFFVNKFWTFKEHEVEPNNTSL